jgi:hypothetical protein
MSAPLRRIEPIRPPSDIHVPIGVHVTEETKQALGIGAKRPFNLSNSVFPN